MAQPVAVTSGGHLQATHRHARAQDYLRPGGPWDVPPLDQVLTEALDGATGTLVVDGPVRLDAAALEDHVARLAGGLRARGVQRGDAVTWQLPNGHQALLLYRACWRLGAVAAPAHHLFGAADLDAVLAGVNPKVALAGSDLPLARRPGVVGLEGTGEAWTALLDAEPLAAGDSEPSDLAAVLFTSGSSGAPKGVLHTQRGLAAKALAMRNVHGLAPGDAVLMPAPLAHVSGLLNGVLVPGVVPMKCVVMAKWSPEAGLDLIESEGVTFMVGPPTFFVAMMRSPAFSPERVTTLRLISSGGAGVTPAFIEAASEAFGAVVKRTYGSTEAPTVTTSHAGDDPVAARETDGRAVGEAELLIVDPGSGETRPTGEAGELWVRGPELCAGYVDADRNTEAFTGDGWFRTGDLGVVDAGGWLTIVGRLKDVIIRGGENISASEVEGVLEAHPSVTQAVAVGYPDERLGERVAAFVMADGDFDLEACRRWFEEQGVARFKTPERIVVVEALPLLGSGKPDRAALRERLAATAG